MATDNSQVNGEPPPAEPIQLAFPLPKSINTTVHMHLTIFAKSVLLFLATRTGDKTASQAPLGSFVYAIPNRLRPDEPPLSTPLYNRESTLEFATCLAKILARRTGKPTYVGSSISFSGAALGGTVDEEMEGLSRVVDVVMVEVENAR